MRELSLQPLQKRAFIPWTTLPDPAYDRTVKSFGRMRKTVHDLIPLPGDAFVRSGGAWQPSFTLELGGSLGAGKQTGGPKRR